MRSALRWAGTWLLALTLPAAAGAQFPRLPGGISIPGAENALYNRAARELLDFRKGPVATSFADVRQAVSLSPSFQPRRYARLLSAPRTATGGFVLTQPGGYQADLQSFCLRAGTHGPSQGDGYLPAPIRGSRATAVQHILEQAPFRPNVPQHDIQVLLWAIVAHTDLDKMPAPMKHTAQQLLGTRDLLALNGGVVGTLIRDRDEVKLRSAIERNIGALAAPLQRIARAESGIRQQVAENGSYAAMEQIAVLAGVAAADQGVEPVPRGRWVQHTQGFYVRYLPYNYTRTRVEVYVPDSLATEARAGSLSLNVSEELAMPASTGSQRLAIIGREQDGGEAPTLVEVAPAYPRLVDRGGRVFTTNRPIDLDARNTMEVRTRDRYIGFELRSLSILPDGVSFFVQAFPLDASGREQPILTSPERSRGLEVGGLFTRSTVRTVDAGPGHQYGTLWRIYVPPQQSPGADDSDGVDINVHYNPQRRP